MPPEQQLPIIKYLKKESEAIVTIDTLEDFVEKNPQKVYEAMSLADIVFIDRNEKRLMDKLDGKSLLVKKGKDGACFVQGGKEYKVGTTPVEDVVDKTGASDVFAGVFLANLAKGRDIEYSMKEASKIATESVKDFGIDHLFKKGTVN